MVTTAEWERLQSLAASPAPEDPTNAWADDPDAADLGHRWFFDPRFSGPLVVSSDLGSAGESGRVSCASCHDPADGGADRRSDGPTSLGVGWTSRNSPTVLGAAWQPWLFWDGRRDTAWSQALAPTENVVEHDTTRLEVAHLVTTAYRQPYEAVFGPAPDLSDPTRFPPSGRPGQPEWDGMDPADRAVVDAVFANFGKAIAAYERLLDPFGAPLDAWLAGDEAALSPAAVRGARLFVGRASCDECHSGPLLADGRFHNVGVPQVGPNVPALDRGRAAGIAAVLADPFNAAGAFSDDPSTARLDGLEATPEDEGAFRTPTLRNVARTPPYMHDGAIATLWDVLEHYRFGGQSDGYVGVLDPSVRPLLLSDADVHDLVSFLEALDGAPADEALLRAPELP